MLNGIKDQIKKQKEMLEAAEIIFEDGSGRNIDDQIVLGQTPQAFNEDADHDDEGSEELKLDGEDAGTDDGAEKPEEGDDPEADLNTSDIGDEPADPEADGKPDEDPAPAEPDDIGNDAVEDPVEPTPDPGPVTAAGDSGSEPLPMPGDDIPQTVGRQTGEPAQDDNVVDVNLDLQSNTLRDVLPVPPAGAASAVVSDQMDQHVDSGFGGDGEPAPAGDPATPPAVESPATEPAPATDPVPGDKPTPAEEGTDPSADLSGDIGNDDAGTEDKPVTEAITLGGDTGTEEPAPAAEEKPAEGGDAPLTAADAGTDPAPAEDPAAADPAAEPAPDEGEGENPVTAAVRDKVAESETPSPEANKEELLKKLGNITKNLEDAKKAVMSAIQ